MASRNAPVTTSARLLTTMIAGAIRGSSSSVMLVISLDYLWPRGLKLEDLLAVRAEITANRAPLGRERGAVLLSNATARRGKISRDDREVKIDVRSGRNPSAHAR